MPQILGTSGSDYLIGDLNQLNEDDVIFGLAGNDILIGLGGSDTIDGDDGFDRLYGNEGNDFLYGRDDNDTLEGGAGVDYLEGNDGNDRLTGDDNRDDLRGGNDDDNLFGGTGDDELYGDNGNDNLYGEVGDDSLYGGRDDDYLSGGEGRDQLFGDQGNDRLVGASNGQPGDRLVGGTGNDVYGIFVANIDLIEELPGEGTADLLYTAITADLRNFVELENLQFASNAQLDAYGNVKPNLMTGNTSHNFLHGRANDDTLYGGQGNDTLDGGINQDTLYGEEGDDELDGGADEDLLCGVDPGTSLPGLHEVDVLTGGTASDLFLLGDNSQVYYNELGKTGSLSYFPESHARITDFLIGTDKIQLKSGTYTLSPYNAGGISGTGIFYIPPSVPVASPPPNLNDPLIDPPADPFEPPSSTLAALPELIGIVQNVQPQQLSLSNPEQFIYV